MILRSGCAAVVALVLTLPAFALDPCGDWQRVFPWPTDASLEGVAWGDGRFVAVGNGVALSSEDGVVWSEHETRPDLLLHAVIRAGDRFVAVGDSPYSSWSQGQVAWSRDGVSWEVASVPGQHLYDIAWDGQRFVAVGGHYEPDTGADLLYSDDGETWISLTNTGFGSLRAVAWGGGVWVAAGFDGLARSLDGAQWEMVAYGGPVRDVAWDGDRFVALWRDLIVVSRDGTSWTELLPKPPGSPDFLAAGGGALVVGWGGGDYRGMPLLGAVSTSSGGSAWSNQVETSRGLDDAVWAGGRWVAVGHDGLVGSSADGQSWRWSWQAWTRNLYDVASGQGELVAVGGYWSYPQVPWMHTLGSIDGVGWDGQFTGGGPLRHVSWAGGRWVAVGDLGEVATSPDPYTWTSSLTSCDLRCDWHASASSPERTVAVGVRGDGPFGLAGTTVDGQIWALMPFPDLGPFSDVLWTDSQFSMVGDQVTAWSSDGVAWSFSTVRESLHKLASDGDRLVAVGEDGAALLSDDGRIWSPASTGTTADLTELVWAGDRFVAGASDGTLLESADGTSWSLAAPFSMSGLEGLAWTGRELVGVTSDARIARRRCGEGNLLPETAPRQLVPVVAHRGGLGGTFWQSDLQVASVSDGWAEVWLGIVSVGSAEPEWRRFMLPPGGQLDRRDLVARTFGLDAGIGPLLVASEQPLAVSSRTSTTGASGTYGQAIPALREDQLVAGATSVVVPMLRHDSSYRTNLGLVNASGVPLTLEVELYDAAGNPLGALSSDLGPFGFIQHDGVLAAVGPVADAYAVVSSRDPAARFAAYGSVVDNATGDPTLVLALGSSAEALVVPAAAHGPGLAGTAWRSDLGVSNPGGVPAAYRLELLAGDASASAELDLGPGETRRHEDVLASVFGFTGTAAIRVVPTAGAVAVVSRTYTPGAGGTFGQGVPAPAESAAIGDGERVVLPGLAESASFRSNIGLVNLGDDPITVTAELHRGDGGLAGTLTRIVPARSLLVTSRVFAAVGAEEVASGYAVVSTNTTGARLLAWASVVDNGSGDPVLVAGR